MKIEPPDSMEIYDMRGRDGDVLIVVRRVDDVTLILGELFSSPSQFVVLSNQEWARVMDSVRKITTSRIRGFDNRPKDLRFNEGEWEFGVFYTNWGDPFDEGLQFALFNNNNSKLTTVELEKNVLKGLL